MRTRLATAIALVALIVAVSGFSSGVALDDEVRLRVAAWNIRHGEGMDHAIDLSRIADVLRRLDADVITLQEVDLGTERTRGVDQVAVVAAQLGYRGEWRRLTRSRRCSRRRDIPSFSPATSTGVRTTRWSLR